MTLLFQRGEKDNGRAKKVLIATHFYPPDKSTTAHYLATIAEALALDSEVVVLCASKSSATETPRGEPVIVEVPSWNPKKNALIRRAMAISYLAIRMFFSILKRAGPNDIVLCVTTPFTLPYAVVLAARLRGAATALLIYDLYPEALEAAGLIKPTSLTARLLRRANGIMFRVLDSIIIIGRDVVPLLQAYPGVALEKISFIPNWTLLTVGYRRISARNRFRSSLRSRFIVGLSGNLGFTHSPRTVFEAAKLLEWDEGIHFILSGWGVGWKELKDLYAAEPIKNVSLLDPVPEEDLVEFLSAADIWIIPYRRNVAGVSIPSRLYNLLAIGRAVIVGAETHSEASLAVTEEKIGWVVPAEDPHHLAQAIREAATDQAATHVMGRRAAIAAQKYTKDVAISQYRAVITSLRNRSI